MQNGEWKIANAKTALLLARIEWMRASLLKPQPERSNATP